MNKIRVPKGEKYYLINTTLGTIEVDYLRDWRTGEDDAFFKTGNYFHTEAEAEVVACKLRAVLKGADVIEMPSEEEIDEVEYTPMEVAESFNNVDKGQVFSFGIRYGIDYLKSKIVK